MGKKSMNTKGKSSINNNHRKQSRKAKTKKKGILFFLIFIEARLKSERTKENEYNDEDIMVEQIDYQGVVHSTKIDEIKSTLTDYKGIYFI